ncbi:MAG TPA: hypothetical protein VIP77_16200 [Jiangellaceae bacterium]
MTDGLDQAAVNAGLDLLRADPGLTVHDGIVPDGLVPPYVLAYTSVARPTDHHAIPLTGQSRGFTVRWILHCVGEDAITARATAQRARTQLLDVRPTVVGLTCNPIRQVEVIPPARDESTGLPRIDAVEVYEMSACL